MPGYTIVLGAVGLIFIFIAWASREDKDSRDSSLFLSAIGGLLIGIFFFGEMNVRLEAGLPIAEFHNGSVYKLVSFDQIADDQKMVVVGLRKVHDNGFWVDVSTSRKLRMYRIPAELFGSQDRMKPPFYIEFEKFGDCGSFTITKKNPLVEKKVQPAK